MFARTAHTVLVYRKKNYKLKTTTTKNYRIIFFYLFLFHSIFQMDKRIYRDRRRVYICIKIKALRYTDDRRQLCNSHLIYAIKSYEVIIIIWECV